jgi:hypothetical protein
VSDDTTDYGAWLQALEQRAVERGEDRVNNICRKAIGRAAARLIDVESRLDAATKPDHGGYCNLHGRHLGEKCPECPYEERIAELDSRLAEALERDRKGDTIIVDLTLERDAALLRLQTSEKMVSDLTQLVHINASRLSAGLDLVQRAYAAPEGESGPLLYDAIVALQGHDKPHVFAAAVERQLPKC